VRGRILIFVKNARIRQGDRDKEREKPPYRGCRLNLHAQLNSCRFQMEPRCGRRESGEGERSARKGGERHGGRKAEKLPEREGAVQGD
jgi:hypothetical protein